MALGLQCHELGGPLRPTSCTHEGDPPWGGDTACIPRRTPPSHHDGGHDLEEVQCEIEHRAYQRQDRVAPAMDGAP